MSGRERFKVVLPQTFFLDLKDLPSLAAYLDTRGEKILSAEKAGEGNMNCTVRVRTPSGSFILKQLGWRLVLAPEHGF